MSEQVLKENSFDKKNEEISEAIKSEAIKREFSQEPEKKKNFAFIIFVVLLLIFGSISVLAYYLFISTNNLSLVTEVEKITKVEDLPLNIDKFSLNKNFEYNLYLSEPRSDLKLIGKAILVNERVIAFPREKLEGILPQNPLENKIQNLIVEKGDKRYQVSSFQLFDSLVFLVLTDFLPGRVEFSVEEFSLGQRIFIHEVRQELVNGNSENINFLHPLFVTAVTAEKREVFTNANIEKAPAIVFNQEGRAVGLSVRKDSTGNLVFVPGEIINRNLENTLLTIESKLEINQNISQLGVEFEFLGLDEFKKQGLPVGPVVKRVSSGSLAELGGIKEKDIITSINNQVFTSQEELDKFFFEIKEKEELKFEIIREGRKVGVTLTLE